MNLGLPILVFFVGFGLMAPATDFANATKSPPAVQAQLYTENDPIQKCLNDRRRAQIKDQQQVKDENKTPQADVADLYPFSQVAASALPSDCIEGSLEGMKQALSRQLNDCAKKDTAKNSKPMKLGCKTYSRSEWCTQTNKRMLEIANSSKDFPSYVAAVKAEFDWYKNSGRQQEKPKGNLKKGDFQFTGYYAPSEVEVRRQPEGEFKYPLYGAPPDLVEANKDIYCGTDPISGAKIKFCRKLPNGRYEALPDKRAMTTDPSAPKGPVQFYFKSPYDIYNLMLQGDGALKVKNPEGGFSHVRLSYDSQNGRARNMLGAIVVCAGGSSPSKKGIEDFLAANPDRVEQLINYDQSYVFFKEGSGDPKGVNDIELTKDHSLATDAGLIRTGAVMMFGIRGLENKCGGKKTSMGVSQDVGGAIQNVHADHYRGEGLEGEKAAYSMNNPGDLFVAVPKNAGTLTDKCPMP